MTDCIARVAVAAPLHSLFDYSIPAGMRLGVGVRVRVSFGRTRVIGLVVAVANGSDCAAARIKAVEAVLDD